MSPLSRSQRRSPATSVVVGIVLVLGAVAVATGVAVATDSPTNGGHITVLPAADSVTPESATTAWATNASGQTFGKELEAKSWSDRPELISVVADNGKVGYVFAKEVDQPATTSLDVREARLKAYLRGRTIPVYESDGVTQIGVTTIGGPGSIITRDGPDGTTITMTANAEGTIITTTQSLDGAVTKTMEALDGTISGTTE